MTRSLYVDAASSTPIWSQIEEGVRGLVASGALSAGGPVPSVRELAKELRVNPATIAKAYQRLTDAGLLTVKRGEGTFVAADPPARPAAERRKELASGATRYAALASNLGSTQEEAEALLSSAWKRLSGDGKGNRK